MASNHPLRPSAVTARDKLLEAAVMLIRTNGYAGTSVDQLCAAAGVTKGAFFHHFAMKEALGVAVVDHWSSMTGAFFADASFHDLPDPVDRVLGYIDLRIALIGGPVEAFSCVAGTLVQEAFHSSAAIRIAAEASIMGNARALEADLDAAIVQTGVTGTTGASLARHVQAVIQGAFILAKTQPEECAADLAREQVAHLRRYFAMLLGRETAKE